MKRTKNHPSLTPSAIEKLVNTGLVCESALLSWRLKRFGDVCTVRQGLQIKIEERFKQSAPNRYKYVTIQHISNGWANPEFIENPSKSVICSPTDVLMTRTGNTGIVVTNVDGVFHNNFFLIDFDRTILDRDFLVNYLRSPRIQHYLLTNAGTSTIPDLNHGDFYSIPVVLPPLTEQKKISEILSCWDSAIETIEKLIDAKTRFKKGLMQRLFKKELDNMIPLGEVLEFSQYGLSNAASSTGAIPMLRMLNLVNGKVSTRDLVYIDLKESEQNSYLLQPKDILFNRTNSQDLVGKTALFSLEGSYVCASYIVRLRTNTDRMLPEYLNYFLNFNPTQQRLKSLATKGVSQSNINPTNLKKFLKVPVPSLEIQQQSIEALQFLDQELGMLDDLLCKVSLQKNGLMQQLLTGNIPVSLSEETTHSTKEEYALNA